MKILFRCVVMVCFLWGHFVITCTAGPDTSNSLKIALVHYGVRYKDPKLNLKELVRLNRKAALEGARIILNTELAVSGYSFQSRQDITPYTETDNGKTIQAIKTLSRELGIYVGITFPERDPLTQSYYNSAFVIDPQGQLVCKYHKIYAEKRWARPGSPYQEGTFDTPWGRIGVAICADSYFGLIPRTMALKDADFLWIPANWPPTGQLSPLEVWQARALENGIYLAACNRTGKDRVMDCRQAVSGVIDPTGTPIFSGSSESSKIFFADIPLNEDGRFGNIHRLERMKLRDIDLYRQIYLDPWVENLTLYYQLPKTGMLDVHCFVPPSSGRIDLKVLETAVEKRQTDHPALWILPESSANQAKEADLLKISKNRNVAFALSVAGETQTLSLITPKGIQPFFEPDIIPSQAFPFKLIHYGPAAIAMVPMEAFRHPELAVVLAKLGCDLVVVSEDKLSSKDLLLSRMRVLNSVAVAACSNNGAQITCMQGLHGNLDQQHQIQPGVCTYGLDTSRTRKKSFQYHIDYDLLLKNN
ncbi:carbon-nitrogen hydrolase family protein [Desulfobacula toluolica]|uniref:carbon-nitrogen hydrolase family protein n=1 Tax=Desulfobacula toluolica TaxID=28223 RepID=UPI00031FA850|nr:carbon-nitrogen hydrolase family protein [Desulfobacula toluolica]